jgi:protein-S-isoprenylcysteine O-methyltransferase Ste14
LPAGHTLPMIKLAMNTEAAFRISVWTLIGLTILMRGCFALRLYLAGERLTPDRAALLREGRAMVTFRAAGFLLLLAALFLYASNTPWLARITFSIPVWLRWSGVVLSLAGLGLWTWTQIELGRQWSAQLTLRDHHRLITTGPYARIRHPMYTAIFFWIGSLALVASNWLFVFMAVSTIAALSFRVPREEKMMLAGFGDQYRDYMNRTGRFLPGKSSPLKNN